ncbi:nucleotidyltransferase domain-containing protein [Streptomyces camelliae]|uniref:Amino acid transporter n=1 Tax=Streptomyces camelliae TaxID=3004093 RepID=A0ABY7NVZ2_9ACTN|nr:amino acid transporter [Streptomyces sp. HUAS 2-6]WBO61495.1 amino acid transporter [Streptomyces sp. HUAS 2-6]
MMSMQDVHEVLSVLEEAGLTAWVDGGWGIDALPQQATRQHSDLDLVVLLPEISAVRSALADSGYRVVLRDWLPTALALADDNGREVDLHPITPTPDGGGDQALPDGDTFHYPPPVRGVIGGRGVCCVDAMTQVHCHLNYEPSAKNRQDMLQLHDRFGVELPHPYSGITRQ